MLRVAALVFAVMVAPLATAQTISRLDAQQAHAIDREVATEMAKQRIPGLSIGIYRRGQILLAKGYGLADTKLAVPVKPETLFQSGSVGKQFTSAAIMLLVEDGKLSLEDPITRYFPEAPASWGRIKIKNLLSHTSGLSDYSTDEYTGAGEPFDLTRDNTEAQMIRKIEALPIEWAPGTKWEYCNTNYVVLGFLIHKVSGMSYSGFLSKRIFQPLGMTSTRLISESAGVPNIANGYEITNGRVKDQAWVAPSFNSLGDGSLYFNVLDLAKWDEGLYTTRLLKQESLDKMWTVFKLNDGTPNDGHYGFGWEITRQNGHKLIAHDGAWQGFTCDISRYVDDSLTVVVLTNLDSDHSDPTAIGHAVAGILVPGLER